MKDFENAQKLFDAYQRDGRFHNLTDALDILEEIIESQAIHSQRAINLKKIIGQHIDTQLNGIYAKGNIDEFGKSLRDEDLAGLLGEALGEEDLRRFGKLLRIKIDYFK